MMALRVGVTNMRLANAFNLAQKRRVRQHRAAQLGPVLPAPARNYIVNACKGELLMVEVAVQHGGIMPLA